jgi:hypothetical protein
MHAIRSTVWWVCVCVWLCDECMRFAQQYVQICIYARMYLHICMFIFTYIYTHPHPYPRVCVGVHELHATDCEPAEMPQDSRARYFEDDGISDWECVEGEISACDDVRGVSHTHTHTHTHSQGSRGNDCTHCTVHTLHLRGPSDEGEPLIETAHTLKQTHTHTHTVYNYL